MGKKKREIMKVKEKNREIRENGNYMVKEK